MDATIVIVGDEILSGATKDTNSGWLAERLAALGYAVGRIVTVPDREEEILEEVSRARARTRFVLVAGGLGPTHDDRTTAALAKLFGRGLVLDEEGWARIARRYTDRFPGVTGEQLESARRMVLVPEGTRRLPNPVGAATAYAFVEGDGFVAVLPGVPAELKGIFEAHVAGALLPPRPAPAVLELDLALPEAAFAAELSRIQDRNPSVGIGSYPHFGERRVTIRFRGPAADAERARDEVLAKFRDAVLGP